MKKIYISLCLLTLFIGFSSNGFAQLTAIFSGNPTSGCGSAIVQFSDNSTGGAHTNVWDFGNGNQSTDPNPSATYNTPGTYTVTLTITNGAATSTATQVSYITVYSLPVASFDPTPDSSCVNSSVNFTSTSTQGTGGAIVQWLWTFDDGYLDSLSGAMVNHSYGLPGTFNAHLTVTDSHGCNSTAFQNVYVSTGPVAQFTATNPTPCAVAPVTINFSNTTIGSASGFQWSFGDGSPTDNSISPSHTYNSNSDFTVTLTALSPGCNSISQTILHLAHVTAGFTMSNDTVCIGSSISFTNTTNPTGGTYHWNFDDPFGGLTNDTLLTNPVHTFWTVGADTVVLISTLNSCRDTVFNIVHVLALPVPIITAIPNPGCSVPFNVQFNVTNPTIASWQWNFTDPSSGANNVSVLQNPIHTFNNFQPNPFQPYHPSVTVTDIYGCVGTTFDTVRLQAPNANFIHADSGCVGSTYTFFSTSTSIDPIVQYIWNFGDGSGDSISTTTSGFHQYNSIGIYDVTLVIVTQSGCRDTIVKPGWARTGTRPIASFIYDKDTVCFGNDPVQFISTTPLPVTDWVWDFHDGGAANGDTVTHDYDLDTALTAHSPFSVTLTVYYNGCADDTTINNIIIVLYPVPDFVPTFNCIDPYTVIFTNFSHGATGYQWSFDDGSPIDISSNPNHTFPHTGLFMVTLTDTNSTTGCSYFKTKRVWITDPQAHFTATPPTPGCYPLSVRFNAEPLSVDEDSTKIFPLSPYFWNFGDPLSGGLNNGIYDTITHVFNNPGIYTVTLTIVDIHNCTSDSTITVTVTGPTAGFTATPTSGCVPLTVNYSDTSHTAGSAINQWYWNFDPSNSVASLTHTYSTIGNYIDTLIVVDANGCRDTAVYTIHSNHPQPNAIPPDSVCPNTPVPFNVTSGPFVSMPVTYHIDYGDGVQDSASTSTNTNIFTHSYSVNGSNVVTIHVTDNDGCDSIFTTTVTVLKPTAAFSLDSTFLCTHQAPFNSNHTSVQIDFTDHSTGLTASGNQWHWYFDNNLVNSLGSIASNPHGIVYDYPGYHSPELIVINGLGCSDTLRLDSVVNIRGPIGTYSFSPVIGCRPLAVTFNGTASVPGLFYTWDFGNGTVQDLPDTVVTYTYNQDGVYHPYYYIGYQLPDGSTCRTVGINSTPDTIVIVQTYIVLDIDSSSVTLHEGGQTTVHASLVDTTTGAYPVTFSWTPANEISALDSNATLTANDISASTYYYCTVMDNLGCRATDSVLVVFIPCDVIDSIPNVFTPNGDGSNDTYYIENLCQGNDFKFTIYNRWGRIIYESTDRYFHWNGKTTGGTDASDGTYYYVLNTGKHEMHGFIELIRNGK